MKLPLMIALLLSTVGGEAIGSSDVNVAEHDRISGEMHRLAERKIWAGVERKFDELEELGTEMPLDDLLIGAHAARELGDVADAHARLQAASVIRKKKEIVDWLADIDNNYGHVDLVAVPTRSAELTAVATPFDPNQRKAVETAIKRARQDGRFRGLLPAGDYNFAGQKFSVVPGISVKIEVSPRMRRQGLIEPVIITRESPGAVLPSGKTD